MKKFLTFLLDVRVLGLLGLGALAAFLFLGATAVDVALVWAAVALGLALLIWLLVWAVRKALARRASKRLEQAIEVNAEQAQKAAPPKERAEIQVLRDRLRSAVKTIRTSKLGESSGPAALYELPWYMIIGNPAAGKSTAIVKSGLKFPFADGSGNAAVQGLAGTRNCDWFFTSEGILLDTAGRYSVHKEDRGEWLGFLDLLKKHRSKAPINGILIAASVAEVAQSNPQDAIQLATNLRQRVQELTEKLERRSIWCSRRSISSAASSSSSKTATATSATRSGAPRSPTSPRQRPMRWTCSTATSKSFAMA
jgi:type VI secretion system protein ImpL